MATTGPYKSSNPTKKNVDYSSQKRVTQFFTPSPKSQKIPVNIEEADTTDSPVPRKRVKKRIIPDSPVKIPVDVIDIDSLSSEDDLVFSPPKKAKAVKRPLPQMSSIQWSAKTEDYSQKKTGLVMRNNQLPATSSFRPVLEEKKNFNIGKTKRQSSADTDVGDGGDRHVNGKKIKYQKSSQDDSNKTNKSIQSSETKHQKIIDSTLKNSVSSKIQVQDRISFGKEKDEIPKKSKKERTKSLLNDLFASKSSEESSISLEEKQFKKRPEVPVFQPKLDAVLEVVNPGSSKSSSENRKRVETTVRDVDIDERLRPSLKQREVFDKTGKSRIVVRRSTVNSEQKDKLSIGSSIVVGLDEIGVGAAVAFKQTYKDIETLLNMNTDIRICPNFRRSVNIQRRPLANSFRVNFEFYMKKDNQIGALNALCSFNCHRYPDPVNLHSILYKILMKAKDQLVLQFGQNQIYEILGRHPPCDAIMKNYYWSVISYHFDDQDPCSRWENLRYLLQKVLEVDGEDAQIMYVNPDLPPSKLECRRAVLGFIIQILSEDLSCWIQEAKEPSTQLRDRINLPLIARVLWSQSTIPHISVACREMIKFHVDALKSGHSCKLSYTKPLVKMMSIVTQLSDLQLPLRVRKPNLHMYNLAREIVHCADYSVIDDHAASFYNSFGSPELSLLLPLTVLNRRKPIISIPQGEQLNLTWLLNSYLEHDPNGSKDAISSFWARPPVERNAFLTALVTYFRLYCAFKTWFHMRNKYSRNSSRIVTHPGQYFNQQPLSVFMFSRTFTPNHLMEDLRLTKYLLEVNKANASKNNSRSIYSLLSWSSSNSS